MTRVAKKTVVGITYTDAQQAANNYASISNSLSKLEAQLNEKIQQVRLQYEPKITDLREQLTEPVETLEAYAKESRKDWDAKSIELSNCIIGFRTNSPSVAKRRGITWPGIIGLFKINKTLKAFVKVKEDIDKAAILKAQADVKLVKALSTVGISIVQEEQFFVDVKKDKVAIS